MRVDRLSVADAIGFSELDAAWAFERYRKFSERATEERRYQIRIGRTTLAARSSFRLFEYYTNYIKTLQEEKA